MVERIYYYVDLFIALCGFDGSDGNTIFGWCAVAVATAIVIYAFYEGVTKAIWPGETDRSHIKYRILEEDDMDISNAN